MRLISYMCIVFLMLSILFTTTSCKDKKQDNSNNDTDYKSNSPSKTDSTFSDVVSSDESVIIGDDVVIDMGEEFFK